MNKVLILSPHPDDGELGAGGTICRFIEEGKEVYYVAFSSCQESLPEGFSCNSLRDECRGATCLMGIRPERMRILEYKVREFNEHRQQILDDLIAIRKEYLPDLVIMPSSFDMHQDHATIHKEALRAFRKNSSLWGYEHPWNNLSFNADVFIKLEQKHVERKINALNQYRSQANRNYMNKNIVKSSLVTRGLQIDLPYAEAFELIRQIY